jgi:hypothetical protein
MLPPKAAGSQCALGIHPWVQLGLADGEPDAVLDGLGVADGVTVAVPAARPGAIQGQGRGGRGIGQAGDPLPAAQNLPLPLPART